MQHLHRALLLPCSSSAVFLKVTHVLFTPTVCKAPDCMLLKETAYVLEAALLAADPGNKAVIAS